MIGASSSCIWVQAVDNSQICEDKRSVNKRENEHCGESEEHAYWLMNLLANYGMLYNYIINYI